MQRRCAAMSCRPWAFGQADFDGRIGCLGSKHGQIHSGGCVSGLVEACLFMVEDVSAESSGSQQVRYRQGWQFQPRTGMQSTIVQQSASLLCSSRRGHEFRSSVLLPVGNASDWNQRRPLPLTNPLWLRRVHGPVVSHPMQDTRYHLGRPHWNNTPEPADSWCPA